MAMGRGSAPNLATFARPLGAVQLRAWAAGTVGRLNVPGPETSFQVFVVAHH